jgi:glutaredoxin
MNSKLTYFDVLKLNDAIKLIATLALITSASSVLHAQQVYKSIDKQGRVTYSEIPPRPDAAAKLVGESASGPAIPYALQQIVNRFPVTLYTTANCTPCVNARVMLTLRGVPFTERTVASNEDIDAYKQINGDDSLPLGTIASQQLKGYQEEEWTKYLDAAGYPKTSTLPRNYRNPEATSLSPKKALVKPEKDVAEKPSPTRPAQPAAPAPQESNNNTSGIKF